MVVILNKSRLGSLLVGIMPHSKTIIRDSLKKLHMIPKAIAAYSTQNSYS